MITGELPGPGIASLGSSEGPARLLGYWDTVPSKGLAGFLGRGDM